MDIAWEAIDDDGDDDGEVEGVEFRLDPKDIVSSPRCLRVDVDVDIQESGSSIFVAWRAAAYISMTAYSPVPVVARGKGRDSQPKHKSAADYRHVTEQAIR